MDAYAFAFERPAADILPVEFELDGHMLPAVDGSFVFRQGTETLVRAFADELRGGRLMRMAVSSIGRLGNRFTICLENGIMLDAGALILALPARYAARALWNLAPDAAETLAAFRYDLVRRVSLGDHKRHLPETIDAELSEAVAFVISTDCSGRVPDRDHRLIQVGMRAEAELTVDDAIRAAARHLGLRATPLVSRVDYWTEADLLSDYGDSHRQGMRAIRDLLPDGVSLIGSDYCRDAPAVRGIARLDERIRAGRQAARAASKYIKARQR